MQEGALKEAYELAKRLVGAIDEPLLPPEKRRELLVAIAFLGTHRALMEAKKKLTELEAKLKQTQTRDTANALIRGYSRPAETKTLLKR